MKQGIHPAYFDTPVRCACCGNAMAIRRSQDWLEEQLGRWKSEIRLAEDAVVIDSTRLSIAAVVDCVWRLGKQRALWK